MDANVLINESGAFEGQYVATRSFKDKEVISSGSDPVKVCNEAREKGVSDPVVFFVPQKDMVHIY